MLKFSSDIRLSMLRLADQSLGQSQRRRSPVSRSSAGEREAHPGKMAFLVILHVRDFGGTQLTVVFRLGRWTCIRRPDLRSGPVSI